MRTVRLKDIADVCGVSTATVSRALNGLTQESNKVTAMIRRTAGEMGYVPNAAALTRLFHDYCAEKGMMHDNDAIFSYLSAFERKNDAPQLSLFD